MTLTGEMLIGAARTRGAEPGFRAIDPAAATAMDPIYGEAGEADVDAACGLAAAAFDVYRETPPELRARFLEAIAEQIEALGDALIQRACAETGLPAGRIQGERGRTTGQLRLFAATVRQGDWLDVRIDPALPDRKPLPRADLRLRQIAIGPVAVFGASNFPLTFSVAGGDTASALAAGCPVVVKAHPAHPGTSEMVGAAIAAAVAQCGLPQGVFSLLFGGGNQLGGALVADRRIAAVGFTGSRAGGLALVRIAASRDVPIPVYAEMSSINPVILLPAALAARGEAIGAGFVASLTLGAGQFCTNPGLILAVEGPGLDTFVASARTALAASAPTTMLHSGIFQTFADATVKRSAVAGVEVAATGKEPAGPNQGQATLFVTDAETFLAEPDLREEIFGAASLLVRCADLTTLHRLVDRLEGQLTVTLQMDTGDLDAARRLLPVLESRAGRILVNGWPTGVEVSPAMVHGGPFPATSDARTTSVGTLAIRRFLRPVCYQDLPAALLPAALRDDAAWPARRLLDGRSMPA